MSAKKALIAMSGGVDSSVAAHLTMQRGYNCIGATMRLLDGADTGDARQVAQKLDAKRVADAAKVLQKDADIAANL